MHEFLFISAKQVITLIGIYLLLVNLVSFLAMGWDKRRAEKNRWRIPERTLFFLALVGGSFGGYLGIWFFRHKTKHMSFTVGFPLIFVLQVTGLLLLYKYIFI